jgi:hypothetical protein
VGGTGGGIKGINMDGIDVTKTLKSSELFIPRPGQPTQVSLNPDVAYLLWSKYGSLAGAERYLEEIGVKTNKGVPYTRQGIHYAAKHSQYYGRAKTEILKERKALTQRIQKDAEK